MNPFSDFRPTQFDHHVTVDGREHWLVAPVSRTRDSEPMEESNFHVALESLGGESSTVEVHRFGHWGPGWFELILIDPSDAKKVKEGEDIAKALGNYPVLDDADLSRREHEEALATWRSNPLSYRVEMCSRAGVCIFAARRNDELPDDDNLSDLIALLNGH